MGKDLRSKRSFVSLKMTAKVPIIEEAGVMK